MQVTCSSARFPENCNDNIWAWKCHNNFRTILTNKQANKCTAEMTKIHRFRHTYDWHLKTDPAGDPLLQFRRNSAQKLLSDHREARSTMQGESRTAAAFVFSRVHFHRMQLRKGRLQTNCKCAYPFSLSTLITASMWSSSSRELGGEYHFSESVRKTHGEEIDVACVSKAYRALLMAKICCNSLTKRKNQTIVWNTNN